ncbi:MAG: hypothetical protein WC809_13890 [Sinimarinibacterium sp.]|jgi:hypothetical protein
MKRRRRHHGLRNAALLAGLCCVLLPVLAQAAAATDPAVLAAAEPPVLRRALVALVCLLGGFALCLRGWDRFDQRQHWRAAGLVVGGCGLSVAALSLLRLSEYPQTWSWWL